MNDITKWDNMQLQNEYVRLVKQGWDRTLDIAKRRKERHQNIKFDNPNFMDYLKTLQQEMENRGLK